MNSSFLAFPSYDGKVDARASKGAFFAGRHPIYVSCQGDSLLAKNFNTLYATALEMKLVNPDMKWFAMLHADIEPEEFWLDKLIAEAELHDADMLSVVVPIKDDRGVTSTAFAKSGDRFNMHTRLTMNQVNHASFPQTFDLRQAADALERLPIHLRMKNVPREALLVNTGCFCLNLDKPWSDQLWFTINDKIEKVDGHYVVLNEPEDWFFSRLLASHGARVMATKHVRLTHHGITPYKNWETWGQPKDL